MIGRGAKKPGAPGRCFCLTGLSTMTLVGCALTLSAILWLAILMAL